MRGHLPQYSTPPTPLHACSPQHTSPHTTSTPALPHTTTRLPLHRTPARPTPRTHLMSVSTFDVRAPQDLEGEDRNMASLRCPAPGRFVKIASEGASARLGPAGKASGRTFLQQRNHGTRSRGPGPGPPCWGGREAALIPGLLRSRGHILCIRRNTYFVQTKRVGYVHQPKEGHLVGAGEGG